MDVMSSSYIPGDPRLIDQIVYELKSQGIFDQFRKECIADVDTKPAYQNLRQRVEGNVMTFLNQQKWSEDMNKNQLREQLRKNISESGYLETGVERIVDQVVNPKINSVFLPKVEDVVYRFLGLEKPNREAKKEVTVMDLLPNDLEAVSPESDHGNTSLNNSLERKEGALESNEKTNDSDTKMDEDVSPPFEPLKTPPRYSPRDENSLDSHLSGLVSHDSNNSEGIKSSNQLELSQDTSQNSTTESQPSITSEDSSKMEVCESTEDENCEVTKSVANQGNIDIGESNNIIDNDVSDTGEVEAKKAASELIKSTDGEKEEEKISKSEDKSKSKSDKEENERKSSSKHRDSSRDHKSSSKNRSKSKDKDKRHFKSDKVKEESEAKSHSRDKDRNKEKDKAKDKSQRDREGRDKESKDKSDREKRSSSSKHREKSSTSAKKAQEYSSKSTGSSNKDKKLPTKDSENNEKDSRTKDFKSSETSGKDKKKSNKDVEKVAFNKDKDNRTKESVKKDKDNLSKNKDSFNKDKDITDKSKSSKEKMQLNQSTKESDGRPKEKSRSEHKDRSKERKYSDNKIKSPEKNRRSDKEKSSSSTNNKNSSLSKKNKEKKPKDDHYSSKEKKNDRRSTDRDSNDGSGKMSRNSSLAESSGHSYKDESKNSSTLFSSGSGDSSNSDQVDSDAINDNEVRNRTEPVKYIKPKFASNIREAMQIMKIRKQLAELERTNALAMAINQKSTSDMVKIKPELTKDKLTEEPREKEPANAQNESGMQKGDIQLQTENQGADKTDLEVTRKVDEPLLQSTELTKERWEELEARLALEMSNVNCSIYETEEEDTGEYDTIVISPKKMKKDKFNLEHNETEMESLTVEDKEVNATEITKRDERNNKENVKLNEEITEHEELTKDVKNSAFHNESEKDDVNLDQISVIDEVEPNNTQLKVNNCLNETVSTLCEQDNHFAKLNNIIGTDVANGAKTNLFSEENTSISPNKVLFVKIDKIKQGSVETDDQVNEVLKSSREDDTIDIKLDVGLSQRHKNCQLTEVNEVVNWNDDDSSCHYLPKPSIASERHLEVLNEFIAKLEKSIEEETLKIHNNIPKIRRVGRKRKAQGNTNNNKSNDPHTLDNKRRHLNSTEVKNKLKEDINICNDGSQDHKFCLPLSPDDSDVDNKKEEPMTVKTKRGYRRISNNNKRYDNEDLYKPRPILTRTRRGQGTKSDDL